MTRFPSEALQETSVDRLSWFEGRWVGEETDELIEEHWSAPRAGTLMGMFRFIRAGEPRFYEFMTIGIEGQEVVLRIKHFHPGLDGWEERHESVMYALVHLDAGQAVFHRRNSSQPNWMIYQREGDDLTVHFADVSGAVQGSRFEFRRQSR